MLDFANTTLKVRVQDDPLFPPARTVEISGPTPVITEILKQCDLNPTLGLPRVEVWLGEKGHMVPIDLWRTTRPKPGSVLLVYYPVEGPAALAAVGTAALSSYAGTIATFITGLSSGFLFNLASIAVTVVGGMLINSLIAPPQQDGSRDDPNFAITGTQNVAAEYRPVPFVCGRHRIYPPLSAVGYSETVNGEIYWRGRYCLGYGKLGLEDIRIGDDPITNFDDVEIEFLNVDKDYTVANNPAGLEDLVPTRLSDDQGNVNAVISEIGIDGSYVYSPIDPAEQVSIKIKPTRTGVGGTGEVYNFRVDTRDITAGGGWVAGDPYQDQDTEVTWTSPVYSDGNLRAFRVVLTSTTDPSFPENAYSILRQTFTPSIVVTEVKTQFHQSGELKMWRFGSERMTLYPDDVQETQYNVLLSDDSPVTRFTTNDAAAASVDISYPQGLFDSDEGDTQSHEANYSFAYRKVGDGSWTEAGTERHRAESTTLIRFTKMITFPEPGEYEIQITRTDSIDNDTGDQNTGYLSAIRSFTNKELPSHRRVTEVAIRIKATDQLNSRVESLNMIAQQFAPKWTGTGWGPQEPVRHPAWIALELMRGVHRSRPVPDSKINRNDFLAWATEEPGWTFDYVFDTKLRLRDALDMCFAAGRAKLHLSDLRYSVIRDGAAGPVRQLFGPRNTWGFQGRLSVTREIHAFRVRFRSERMGWEQDEITVYMDGYNATNATKFEDLDLPGVVVTQNEVDQGNVYKLARYHLAVAVLRPEIFEFSCDFENLTFTRGDKIRFAYDASLSGVGSARIKSIISSGGDLSVITLDDVFPGAGGEDFRMTIRKADGTFVNAIVDNRNTLEPDWTVLSSTSSSGVQEGDLVIIERAEQDEVELLVTGIFAEEDLAARIRGVPAAPEVLTADTEVIPPYDPNITLLPERFGPPKPEVTDFYSDERSAHVDRDNIRRVRVAVEFAPYIGPRGVRFQLRWTDLEQGGWLEGRQGAPTATMFTGYVPEKEAISVEARAVDKSGNHRGWVRVGTVNASAGTPTRVPSNWAGRPTFDGIDFDGSDPSLPSNPALQRGTDIVGWNIYHSESENGTYAFLTYTESLKTLISDTGDVRWFRFASVNYSGAEGPLGPAFFVPQFEGVRFDDLAQQLRDDFDDAFAAADDVRADIEDEIDELKSDIFADGYDTSVPLSERVGDIARASQSDNLVRTVSSLADDTAGGWNGSAVNDGSGAIQVPLEGAHEGPSYPGNPNGRIFAYRGEFRTDNPTMEVRVMLRGGNSKTASSIISTSGSTIDVTGSWQTFEGEFEVTEDALYFRPGLDGSGAGNVQFRNLVIHEVTWAKKRVDVLAAVDGDNAAAITAEQQARISGDNSIISSVEALETEVGNNSSAIVSEEQARISDVQGIAAVLDSLNTRVGDNEADISNIETTSVDPDGVIAVVEQEISATYGSLSGLASDTSFARATADRVVTGHMWKVIGGYWELVGMNDGQTDTSTTRIRSDRIRLAGDTQITGSFHVSGDTVILDGNTQINGSFEVTGDTVRLDSNTTITGGFQVTGDSVRLDSDTVINGNFVLAGDHITLSSGTNVNSSFTLQGRNIELDGNVDINGSFEVSGGNVRLDSGTNVNSSFVLAGRHITLDGNTTVNGTFEVTDGMIVAGRFLEKRLVATNGSDNTVNSSAQETVVALSVPQGQQSYAWVGCGFTCEANGANTVNYNWKLFADLTGLGNPIIAQGSGSAPGGGGTVYESGIAFDGRSYNGRPCVLTLVVEVLNSGMTVSDAVIEMRQVG